MGDTTFPRWNEGTKNFDPPWTEEQAAVATLILGNVYEEVYLSNNYHRADKAMRGQPGHQQHHYGWLERKRIWDRACLCGAIASVVIELKGLQLKPRNSGDGYDTTTPANQVSATIKSIHDDRGQLHESIHDVVYEIWGKSADLGPEIDCTLTHSMVLTI